MQSKYCRQVLDAIDEYGYKISGLIVDEKIEEMIAEKGIETLKHLKEEEGSLFHLNMGVFMKKTSGIFEIIRSDFLKYQDTQMDGIPVYLLWISILFLIWLKSECTT